MSANRIKISQRTSSDLSMIRGLAALAVAAGHLRGLFFVDYKQLDDPPELIQGMYFATGFGHQAVMVFFVLSGFLISASVLNLMRNGWSWRHYLVNRVTRLYLALLPALAVTLMADRLGMAIDRSGWLYWKHLENFGKGIVAHNHGAAVFLGNAAFLQTIYVPSYGSNGPLWSLANEFWYYLLFPLLVVPCFGKSSIIRRVAMLAGAGAVAYFLPAGMLMLFPVWLMGAALHWIPAPPLLSTNGWVFRHIALGTSVGLFFVTLTVTRLRPMGLAGEYAIGFSCALVIYVIAHGKMKAQVVYQRWANTLAGFSYSLYAVHFPLLLLSRAVSAPTERWPPTIGTGLAAAGILAVVMLSCYWFARVTEAKTPQVRRWLLDRLA